MKKTLSLLLVFTVLLSACTLKSTSPAEVEVAEPEASEMEVHSAAPETADEGLAIPLSAGTATMVLTPASSTVNVGQTFNLSVQVAAGAQSVNTVQVSLQFDPTYLEVMSLTQVGDLDLVVQNTYDNAAGTISYAAGKTGGSVTGTFSVVQIQLKAKATSPSTAVQFLFVQPLASDVIMEGLSVLAAGGTTNASVTIQGGGSVPTVTPGPGSPTVIPGTATTYVVQAGDNLYRIGLKFGLPWTTIQSYNNLPSTLIYVGQVLNIPGSGSVPPVSPTTYPTLIPGNTHHTVVAGQNLFRIGLIYGVQWPAIMAANGLYSTLIYPGQVLFIP
ncbi:MAG: LysM peptidoglycan-binding domain-containing protein [Anaerolineaceae bacterium]|nr:LysM peptidoglycan-binding domain-containing protein [Anaerolineaceae bacterium]